MLMRAKLNTGCNEDKPAVRPLEWTRQTVLRREDAPSQFIPSHPALIREICSQPRAGILRAGCFHCFAKVLSLRGVSHFGIDRLPSNSCWPFCFDMWAH
jgi:hypothetical protein